MSLKLYRQRCFATVFITQKYSKEIETKCRTAHGGTKVYRKVYFYVNNKETYSDTFEKSVEHCNTWRWSRGRRGWKYAIKYKNVSTRKSHFISKNRKARKIVEEVAELLWIALARAQLLNNDRHCVSFIRDLIFHFILPAHDIDYPVVISSSETWYAEYFLSWLFLGWILHRIRVITRYIQRTKARTRDNERICSLNVDININKGIRSPSSRFTHWAVHQRIFIS